MDLKTAYASLKADENAIRSYLSNKGIAAAEMIFSAITINKEFESKTDENGKQVSQVFTGYNLTQTVTIQSGNVDKIDAIPREATELIENGIEFNSSAPQFYNTKL